MLLTYGNKSGSPLFIAPGYLQRYCDFFPGMDVWAPKVIFIWMITAMELGALHRPMLEMDEGFVQPILWRTVGFAMLIGLPPDGRHLFDLVLQSGLFGRWVQHAVNYF